MSFVFCLFEFVPSYFRWFSASDVKKESSKSSDEKPERSTQAEYTAEQLQYVQRYDSIELFMFTLNFIFSSMISFQD